MGEFQYRYLPKSVYPYGILREESDGIPFLIASPEKALCDALYKVSPVTRTSEMGALLLENWRMDWDELRSLDWEWIRQIAPLYHARTLQTLIIWHGKEVNDAKSGS